MYYMYTHLSIHCLYSLYMYNYVYERMVGTRLLSQLGYPLLKMASNGITTKLSIHL